MNGLSPLTVGLLQFDVRKGDLKANMDAVSAGAKEAGKCGVDWLLLPELFSSSYDLENAARWSEINRGEVLPTLSRMAAENHLAIIGTSILSLASGGYGNTLVWFDAAGNEIERYIKLHRFKPMNEDKYLTPGEAPVIARTPYGIAGLSICYDLRFPELYRFYLSKGALFAVLPCQWPNPRLKHFETLIRARAIENQMVVIAVNRVGTEGNNSFFGHSMIVDPWGETICNAREEEILLVCMLNPADIVKIRKDFPVIDDIRHDTWKQ